MQHFKGMEETSTNGSETPPSSPISRRPKQPLSRSVSLRPRYPHMPQCDCDRSLRVMGKTFSFWSGAKKTATCGRFRAVAARVKPQRGEEIYQNLLLTAVDTKEHIDNLHQIELDLGRTYPDEPYFGETGEGREVLKRMLTAFSNYDPVMGYVQGMNFIAAALLWHTTESDSFWLLVHFMEDYDLRDNYGPSLPGLNKHCQIVNLILIEHLPRLHLLFCTHRISCELFITDWCLTLFGSLVPLQDMGFLLSQFLCQGWAFFYRVVLVILSRLQSHLLQSTDVSDILSSLRPPNKSQRHWREFVSHLEHGRESLSWARLFKEADSMAIDEDYIHKLHFGFRLDTSRFGQLE